MIGDDDDDPIDGGESPDLDAEPRRVSDLSSSTAEVILGPAIRVPDGDAVRLSVRVHRLDTAGRGQLAFVLQGIHPADDGEATFATATTELVVRLP